MDSRHKTSTIPHDQIHAFLGLVGESALSLKPDYRKSRANLWCAVALEDIMISGNLHALIRSRIIGASRWLPSWCTDWGSLDYWAEDRSRILTEVYAPLYSATASQQLTVETLPFRENVIRVKGQVVDTICQCSDALSFERDRLAYYVSDRDVINDIRKLLGPFLRNQPYITGGSIFNAF